MCVRERENDDLAVDVASVVGAAVADASPSVGASADVGTCATSDALASSSAIFAFAACY